MRPCETVLTCIPLVWLGPLSLRSDRQGSTLMASQISDLGQPAPANIFHEIFEKAMELHFCFQESNFFVETVSQGFPVFWLSLALEEITQTERQASPL